MNYQKRVLIFAVAAVGILVLNGCGSSKAPAEESPESTEAAGGTSTVKEVEIAETKKCDAPRSLEVGSVGQNPLVAVAETEKFFANQCLKVTRNSEFEDDEQLLAALSAGEVDLAAANTIPAVVAIGENGEAFRIVAGRSKSSRESDSVTLSVGETSRVTDVTGLESKKIAVVRGDEMCSIVVKQVLANAGVPNPFSAARFNVYDDSDGVAAALADGNVEAACLTQPDAAQLVTADASQVAGLSSAFPGGLITEVTVASNEYAEQSENEVDAFNAAMSEAAKWSTEDDDRFRSRLPQISELTKAEAEIVVLPLQLGGAEVQAKDFELIWSSLQSAGMVKDDATMDELFG